MRYDREVSLGIAVGSTVERITPDIEGQISIMSVNKQASDRYLELLELYKKMHLEGEKFLNIPASDTFPGQSLLPHADRIKSIIRAKGIETALDYGSGKGRQYASLLTDTETQEVFQGLDEYWGISVTCYDPAYEPYAELPARKMDAVICTDALEHCPEEDMQWIIEELFGLAETFVYANVACYPATKRLENGENAHATIKPMEWWTELVSDASGKFPDVGYLFIFEEKDSPESEATYASLQKGIPQPDLSPSSIRFKRAKTKRGFLRELFKK